MRILKHATTVTAIVGCLTGVASLAWQMWEHNQPPADRIHATYSIGVPWHGGIPVFEAEELSIEVMVTNVGSHDVFIDPIAISWDSHRGGRTGEVLDEAQFVEPLQPGEKKVYAHTFSEDETDRYMHDWTTKNGVMTVRTSRGEQIEFDDLPLMLEAFAKMRSSDRSSAFRISRDCAWCPFSVMTPAG